MRSSWTAELHAMGRWGIVTGVDSKEETVSGCLMSNDDVFPIKDSINITRLFRLSFASIEPNTPEKRYSFRSSAWVNNVPCCPRHRFRNPLRSRLAWEVGSGLAILSLVFISQQLASCYWDGILNEYSYIFLVNLWPSFWWLRGREDCSDVWMSKK